MHALNSAGSARAVPANDIALPDDMALLPVVTLCSFRLRPRALDGSYPFRGHRTVAEVWTAEGARG